MYLQVIGLGFFSASYKVEFSMIMNTLASGLFRGFSHQNNRIARGFART